MTWSPENNTTPWGLLSEEQREELCLAENLLVWIQESIWRPKQRGSYQPTCVYRSTPVVYLNWGDFVTVDGVRAVVLCAGKDWFSYVLEGQRSVQRGWQSKTKVVKL